MKDRIKALRIAASLTQAQVAREMGYESASAVTMWETGDRKPPSDKLPKLAEVLGCSIDDLFGNTADIEDNQEPNGQQKEA